MGNKSNSNKTFGKQLVRHSWDVVNPGLNKPEKEAVVPKEFKTSKEEDIAVGPQGRCYVQAW